MKAKHTPRLSLTLCASGTALMLLTLDARFCDAQQFCDNFNRPDSLDIGNGWLSTSGNSGGNLVLQNGTATTTAIGAGGAGIYRPFAFTGAVTVSGRVTQMNGDFSLERYDDFFTILNDGTLFAGYGIEIARGDQNYNDSRVNLTDHGTVVATVYSTFQYGAQIQVIATWFPDGIVTGSISDTTDTFNFTFGARSIQSTGNNFSWGTTFPDDRDSTYTFPTLDNICLGACPTIVLSPTSLPLGTVGGPYAQQITASGGAGPYTFALTAGAIPSGLNLAGSGILSGIPTTAGTFNFRITSTDSTGCTGSQPYSIIVECFGQLGADGLPVLKWPLDGTLADYNVAMNRWDYPWIRTCGVFPKRHNALDLTLASGATVVGKPVYAVDSGVVVAVYNACGTKGCPKGVNWESGITIVHTDTAGNKWTSNYIHVVPLNGRNAIKVGKTVSKGQQIATVGAIYGGGVTGPHLHFSIRRAPYSNTANRGALPDPGAEQGNCLCTDDLNNTDPVFPEFFIDPSLTTYQ